MYTVGYVAYVQFVGAVSFPDGLEHLLRYLAVEPAYTVHLLAGVAGKYTHRELLVGVGVFATHVHQVFPFDAQFGGELTHVLAEERLVEVVVTGRYRRVYRIERRSTHYLEGFAEFQMFVLYIVYQPLYIQQGSMALVAVVEIGLDTQLVQHQGTADTQQILLFHTVFPVTAVELVGDGAVPFAVRVEVGVEQIEFDAAYIHAPDVGIDNAAGVGNLEYHRTAVFFGHLLDGELVEVLGLVVGNLLTVHRECLREVAIAVEETDGRHIDVAVAGLFQIVAGQNTETARIYFQNVAQAIFHAEVGDRRYILPLLYLKIFFEMTIHLFDVVHELFVLGNFLESFIPDALQE